MNSANPSLIQRGIAFLGAIAGTMTGQIVSKNTHAGYPIRLIIVAMACSALATLYAQIGRRLGERQIVALS